MAPTPDTVLSEQGWQRLLSFEKVPAGQSVQAVWLAFGCEPGPHRSHEHAPARLEISVIGHCWHWPSSGENDPGAQYWQTVPVTSACLPQPHLSHDAEPG